MSTSQRIVAELISKIGSKGVVPNQYDVLIMRLLDEKQ